MKNNIKIKIGITAFLITFAITLGERLIFGSITIYSSIIAALLIALFLVVLQKRVKKQPNKY